MNVQRWYEIQKRGEARIAAMTPEDHKLIFEGNALMQSLSRNRKPTGAVISAPNTKENSDDHS